MPAIAEDVLISEKLPVVNLPLDADDIDKFELNHAMCQIGLAERELVAAFNSSI